MGDGRRDTVSKARRANKQRRGVWGKLEKKKGRVESKTVPLGFEVRPADARVMRRPRKDVEKIGAAAERAKECCCVRFIKDASHGREGELSVLPLVRLPYSMCLSVPWYSF